MRISGLELAVHRGVRRVALRPAADRRDLPAVRLLAEEQALAPGQVDLGVGELDVDVAHRARLELDAGDRVGARLLLLALELLLRVLAERAARRAALVAAVGGEEAGGGRVDRVPVRGLAASAGRGGGHGEQRETRERRPHAVRFDLPRATPALVPGGGEVHV